MTPEQEAIRAKIPIAQRCEVCNGEQVVSYFSADGRYSEPAACYKCNGTGRREDQQTTTEG